MDDKVEFTTKEKILTAAKQLFAEKGYNGTTTREIANLANVNLAALHYYFQNKNHLYDEVLKNIHEEICNITNNLLEESHFSTKQLIDKLMHRCLEMGRGFLEKFRILSLVPAEIMETFSREEGVLYGPGGQAIYECLNREYGDTADIPLKQWAARVIAAYIYHSTLRYHLTKGTKSELPVDMIINDIYALTDAVLSTIQKNRNIKK